MLVRQCMCRAPRNMASNDVDHKNDVVPSSSRGHSYNDNPLHKVPQPPQKYKLRCAVKENHQHPIYCVAFSRHIHRHNEGGIDNLNSAVFATCGGNYSTIYEIDNSGNIDGESPLTIRQVYRDVDPDEVFYTCAFGGRGVVGSPVGFSTAGGDTTDNRDRDMHGSISFGHELHKEKQQYNSMNGVKRLKVDDAARPCGKLDNENASKSQSTFHLPFSASQTGPPLLCLAGTRGIIKVIDTYRRSLYMTLSGHGNDITDLKFSPTNEWLLLSSSKDESVRLWNLQRGVNVAVFSGDYGHRGQVLSVSWHMSGSKIATCAMDNTVKLWRIFSDSNKQEGGEGDSKCGPIETAVRKSFTVVPDSWSGNNQACQKFKTIFHQFPYFSTDEAHTNYVDCVQFVGDLILSKSVSNKVVLWKPLFNDKESEQIIHVKHRVPSSILFLREFTLDHCGSWYVRFESPPPYHQILALGNQKGVVKIWRLGENGDDDSGCNPNQKHYCKLKTSEYFNGGHYDQSTVRMVAFNPHGLNLVAVKDDSTVWVWDPEF